MAGQEWHQHVPDEAYLGFDRELKEGPEWGALDASPHDSPDKRVDDPNDIPFLIFLKLMLMWVRARLAHVVGVRDSLLDELDLRWDSAQRQLHLLLAFHEVGLDAAKREAALYLRPLFTRGNGLEQITYSYWKEAEFGDMQLSLLNPRTNPKVMEAVALLGLQPVLDSIREATLALSRGIGRTPGSTDPELPPSQRLKQARLACRNIFSDVFRQLQNAISFTRPGPKRERLERLLSPLTEMLEKNPRPKSKAEAKKQEEEEEEPNAAPTPKAPEDSTPPEGS